MNSLPVFCSQTVPSSLDNVRHHIKLLTIFLEEYKWLTDAYLSDYFMLDHSKHIKPSWWKALKSMNLIELAAFLKSDHWQARKVWPLSLLAFRASIHSLHLQQSPVELGHCIEKLSHALPRTHAHRFKTKTGREEGNGQSAATVSRDWRAADEVPLADIQDGQHLLLEHCYRRHVKPKKQHEILVLAKAVAQLTCQVSCAHVVDVGAGQGHLSRLLSFGYGLHVTTIEAASCHAPKAIKFDGEVKRDISRGQCISKKRRKKMEAMEAPDDCDVPMALRDGPDPSHVVAWVDANITVTAFLRSVQTAQNHQQIANAAASGNKPLLQRHQPQNDSYRGSHPHHSRCAQAHSVAQTGAPELCDSCASGEASTSPACDDIRGVHPTSLNATVRDCGGRALGDGPVPRDGWVSGDGSESRNGLVAEDGQGFEDRPTSGDRQRSGDGQMPGNRPESGDGPTPVDGQWSGYGLPAGDGQRLEDRPTPGVGQWSGDRPPAVDGQRLEDRPVSVDGKMAGDGPAPPFVLTGLHACGDLTPTMLRVFVSCPQARGLAAVSCCYMKMDMHVAERGDREVGYPLSHYITSLGGHPLSWEAREMACHFIDAYYDRLTEAHRYPNGQSMAHLRTHCYRAALQEVIMQKDPSIQHGSIKLTLKKAHRLPFDEYAEKALGRLGLEPRLTPAQMCVARSRLDRWKEVVAFYVLRLSLAPLIESLILLDRIMYLAENGINVTLVPMFDPSLSPRNFALLATK